MCILIINCVFFSFYCFKSVFNPNKIFLDLRPETRTSLDAFKVCLLQEVALSLELRGGGNQKMALKEKSISFKLLMTQLHPHQTHSSGSAPPTPGTSTSLLALPTLISRSYRSSSTLSMRAASFLQVSCTHTQVDLLTVSTVMEGKPDKLRCSRCPLWTLWVLHQTHGE